LFSIFIPVAKDFYLKIRSIPDDKFPDTKGLRTVLKDVSDEKFKQHFKLLKHKIEETDDLQEKKFFEDILNKISEIKNWSDVIDENTDKEFLFTIANELDRATRELLEKMHRDDQQD